MQSTFKTQENVIQVKRWLIFIMSMLIISGLTAMPIQAELSIATRFFPDDSLIGGWLHEIYSAVKDTRHKYPYLFYGYDWLAFAHIVIAIAFFGPYRDPVKNKWVIEFGAIACLLIIPFAFIAGYVRGIPVWWRLVDCSFGILALIPLGICHNKIEAIEKAEKQNQMTYSF